MGFLAQKGFKHLFGNRDNEMQEMLQLLSATDMMTIEAEALNGQPGFRDKNLDEVMTKIDTGLDELTKRHPGLPRQVSSGLRGTKYFIEFPFSG